MCPKHKLFRGYIDLEIKLREFDRCRKLYEKWAEFDPENCKMWIQFATLEAMLNDSERARGIYELAICQPRLDMPEYMWKSYIDFEVSCVLLFLFLFICLDIIDVLFVYLFYFRMFVLFWVYTRLSKV